jgi:hypothetical protein
MDCFHGSYVALVSGERETVEEKESVEGGTSELLLVKNSVNITTLATSSVGSPITGLQFLALWSSYSSLRNYTPANFFTTRTTLSKNINILTPSLRQFRVYQHLRAKPQVMTR